MAQSALSPAVLMNVSEWRIDDIRWTGSEEERSLVSRLFESPKNYGHWETFHSELMKAVSDGANRKGQLYRLRQARFALIHRQALFQYLRDKEINGACRETLVRAFYESSDYMSAVVREHGRFLQSNSSIFCADHLAGAVLHDRQFSVGIKHYRRSYMDYFSLYCSWILAEADGEDYPLARLVPEAKKSLAEMQARLLATPIRSGDRSAWPRARWH